MEKERKDTADGRLAKSFDIIGDIAVVKFEGKLSKKDKKTAVNDILENNRNVKRVFEKVGMIQGEERIPKLKLIIGKGSLTTYKENGCSFYVDVKKVFFSPRMSNERLRVIKQVKDKENILDMFCGVGPFAIPIAKKARKVTAIDINSHAIKLLKDNINLNKVKNVEVYCGDSKKLVKKIDDKFDRVIMNFPLYAYKFLDEAVKKCDKKAVIHLYSFIKNDDTSEIEKTIKEKASKSFKKVKIKRFKAGEVAPFLTRYCFDISLSS